MNYQFIICVNTNGGDGEEMFGEHCSDALLARRKGNLFLDFDRDADTFAEAVRSATYSVELSGGTVTAILGAEGGK